MFCKKSIGRSLESNGRPVELLYWTSPRAEDLADYLSLIIAIFYDFRTLCTDIVRLLTPPRLSHQIDT